ncbi:MAG: hypothetical protein ACPG80_04110, partial [Rickettsiales bacterium]
LYQKVAQNLNAPMRPYASYMLVRLFYYQDKAREAAEQIRTILADDTLKDVHAMAENYRFIMLWQDRDVTFDAPLLEDFLAWLLKTVAISPEKAVDIEQSMNDFTDAKLHLNHYFPLYDHKSKTVDWWLRDDVEIASPRMQAVKALASTHETVDWLQSTWALNIFDADWLWAIHAKNAPYWKQNKHIADHVWKRWQAGDGLEWLEIAIARIHPEDPLVPEIISAATPYFVRDWKTESDEYRSWLANIWKNTIRLHIGRGEYAEALALIRDHKDYANLLEKRLYHRQEYHQLTLLNTLRWLVYIGEWDQARVFLKAILEQYPTEFTFWRTLLAKDWQEAMASAYSTGSSYRGSFSNNSQLWQSMVNLLPAKILYDLARDQKINEAYRGVLVNAALTRAMLLGQSERVKQYAVLAAKLHPEMREKILQGVEANDRDDYIDLMLHTPRLRPVPFTAFWHRSRN